MTTKTAQRMVGEGAGENFSVRGDNGFQVQFPSPGPLPVGRGEEEEIYAAGLPNTSTSM